MYKEKPYLTCGNCGNGWCKRFKKFCVDVDYYICTGESRTRKQDNKKWTPREQENLLKLKGNKTTIQYAKEIGINKGTLSGFLTGTKKPGSRSAYKLRKYMEGKQ